MMASFEMGDRTVQLLMPAELTLREAEEIQAMFGVAGLLPLERGMFEAEPAAWRALLLMSARRALGDVEPYDPGFEVLQPVALLREIGAERDAAIATQPDGEGPAEGGE